MLPVFLISLFIIYLPLPARPATAFGIGHVAGILGLMALYFGLWQIGVRLAAAEMSRKQGSGRLRTLHALRSLRFSILIFTFLSVNLFQWQIVPALLIPEGLFIPLAADMLLITPLLVMTAIALAGERRIALITGEMRTGLRPAGYLYMRFRTELGIILLPWALLTFVTDISSLIRSPGMLVDTAVASALAVSLVLFGPCLLRLLWPSAPLPPGPLKRRLHAFAGGLKFRYREIFLWKTWMQIPNAAVIGITGFLRYIFISDVLLARFSEEELESIFAHEAGHIKHHHFVYYLLMIACYAAFLTTLTGTFNLSGTGAGEPLLTTYSFPALPVSAVILLSAVLYWGVLFGFISRRFEREADLFSMAHSSRPTAFISALEKLATLSGRNRSAGGWRHFSIEHRVRFLRKAEADAGTARRAARSAGLLKFLIAASTAASGAAILWF